MDDVEEIRLRKRNREPLLYCKLMASKPGLWFGLTLGGHVLLTVLNPILYAAGYDILPIELMAFPVMLKGDTTCQREYAWDYRDNDTEKIRRFTADDIGPTWKRGYAIDYVTLYYTAGGRDNNVFQKVYFEQMRNIEEGIFNLSDYRAEFCQLDRTLKCQKPTSILRYFDGTFSNYSSVLYDPNFEDVTRVLYEAYTHPETRDDFKYFLGRGYRLSPSEASSNATRAIIPIGWPLEGPGTEREKNKRVEAFLISQVEPILESATVSDGLTLNYISVKLFETDVLPQALKDMALATGSLLFIFIFIWIQTGSFWITGWAVLSIVTSFFITNLFYRIVLNYQYFGYFHIIAIFIILGIGADDIFVFYNIWQSSFTQEFPSVAHRLSHSYRRAAGTMLFTSFTTMMAFLIGGISPVLPLGSFGIFTGVLVAVNYISVVVFFPNVLLMHHLYFEQKCCPCCSCCSCCSEANTHGNTFRRRHSNVGAIGVEEKERTARPSRLKKKNPVVRFFAGRYFRFVTHYIVRWIIIVVFVAFTILMALSSSRIEASSEQINIYRDTTNYGKAMTLESTAFIPSGDDFVALYLVWGLVPRDFEGCHFTDWQCSGKQEWDPKFELNTAPAQFALQEFCNKLSHNLSPEELAQLMIQNNSHTGQLEIDCFTVQLESYMQKEQNFIEDTLNQTIDLRSPLAQMNMDQYMRAYPHIYEPDQLGRDFYRYFELGVSSWLSSRYTMQSTPDYITYNPLVGEAKDGPHTRPVAFHADAVNGTDMTGWYGSMLRYAAIQVNLSLSTVGLDYANGLRVMDNWESFFNQELSKMPPPLQGGFQVTETTWQWLRVQEELVRGAWLGILIGLCIALPVLILATMNLALGVMATLVLGCVICGVLGVIPLANWKIDVMVSMNLCLIVGLSVDYVVHLAEGYHLSEHHDRLSRVQDMLENLGLSVLLGAVTTLGAALFMLFAKIQFFFQFGTFLFCSIGFSLAFSLVFFPAVLSLIGPEGQSGSIAIPFQAASRYISGWRKDSERCDKCEGKGFIAVQAEEITSKPETDIQRHEEGIPNGLSMVKTVERIPNEEEALDDFTVNQSNVETQGTAEAIHTHTGRQIIANVKL